MHMFWISELPRTTTNSLRWYSPYPSLIIWSGLDVLLQFTGYTTVSIKFDGDWWFPKFNKKSWSADIIFLESLSTKACMHCFSHASFVTKRRPFLLPHWERILDFLQNLNWTKKKDTMIIWMHCFNGVAKTTTIATWLRGVMGKKVMFWFRRLCPRPCDE